MHNQGKIAAVFCLFCVSLWSASAGSVSGDPLLLHRVYAARTLQSASVLQHLEAVGLRDQIGLYINLTHASEAELMLPLTPTSHEELRVRGLGWLMWSRNRWAKRSRNLSKRAQAVLLNRGYLPPKEARILGHWLAIKLYHWGGQQWQCLDRLWGTDRHGITLESGWKVEAKNPNSPAQGIPQADPGSKMVSAGLNWAISAYVQIVWGLHYIRSNTHFHTPCEALDYRLANGSY
jgi:hypothetical protein